MIRDPRRTVSMLIAAVAALSAKPVLAASLQQVTDWGATGVPTYIAMFIYVPDKLATNPPILVVSHYCSGDAAGVFSEAQGGGIVAASDQYGFIMIYPQNHLPGTTRNCWDVGSTASLTHNGGGDTQAIAEMVQYTITTYKANPDRVYATGTSSGAMMTEALLAVYPDVFKAGAEFSGVPAGCWSDGYDPSNQWSGNCATGVTTFTAQQWGDKVRAMYPGYSGYRPRIQLWHGAADTTISPNNQTEAIKEWTNVLGLGSDPTSTTSVSLNSHSWTRQSWQNACGYTVLDAWLEANGPHGTDANLNAQYVIPFLGLDKSAATDPEIAQCGTTDAGTPSADGAVGGGGGSSEGSGGSGGSGGGAGAGGSPNTGGRGGTSSAGGAAGSAAGSGGSKSGSGGSLGNGGGSTSSGSTSSGGTSAGGANGSSGGASAASASGGSASGGSASGQGGSASGGASASGCSCRLGQRSAAHPRRAEVAMAMALLLLAWTGKRRRA